MPLQFRTAQLPPDITPFVLAKDEVAFVGEAVAVVIAGHALSRRGRGGAGGGRLRAAAGGVGLPGGARARRAARPSRPHQQRADEFRQSYGDVAAAFARAPHRASVNLKQHRGGAHSIEGRGALAAYDVNEDRLTLWSSTQLAHEVRAFLMTMLRLDENQVRVVAPDVGGGFGAKFVMYPEEVTLAAALPRCCGVRSNGSRTGASISSPPCRSATSIGTSRSRSTTTAGCSACAAGMIHDEGAYTPQGINLPLQRVDRRCPAPTSCRPTSSTCRWSRPTRSPPCRCAAPAIPKAPSRMERAARRASPTSLRSTAPKCGGAIWCRPTRCPTPRR